MSDTPAPDGATTGMKYAVEVYRARKAATFVELGIPSVGVTNAQEDHLDSCGYCGLPPTEDGYDGCIGYIPGVANACCGHGLTSAAYLQDANGMRVDAPDTNAIAEFNDAWRGSGEADQT